MIKVNETIYIIRYISLYQNNYICWDINIAMLDFLITWYWYSDCNWYRLGALDETPCSGKIPRSHSFIRVHLQTVMIAAAEDAYRKISVFLLLVIWS